MAAALEGSPAACASLASLACAFSSTATSSASPTVATSSSCFTPSCFTPVSASLPGGPQSHEWRLAPPSRVAAAIARDDGEGRPLSSHGTAHAIPGGRAQRWERRGGGDTGGERAAGDVLAAEGDVDQADTGGTGNDHGGSGTVRLSIHLSGHCIGTPSTAGHPVSAPRTTTSTVVVVVVVVVVAVVAAILTLTLTAMAA